MNSTKEDRERDQILGRMLNTPPDPKVGTVKKKTKKKRRVKAG
jgi:hypothetical protein